MDDDLIDLMICRIPGLKGDEKIKLVKEYDDANTFFLLSKRDIENSIGRTLKDAEWNMADVQKMAINDAEQIKKMGIHRVSYREKAYPPLLREIFDPPALLFYRGTLADPGKPMVAVVGTRKPTSQAAERAFALGRGLGLSGIPVVSGLAMGIDAMAHRGNIEGKAGTIAILGSGVDMVFPSLNRALARRILENGGAIVSEYPPGTPPAKWNFPARNRIISALSRGVVIVEAPQKSGALITAQFALEQGRDLWVDSYGVKSPNGAGTASLAEQGAGLINSAEDILAEWNMPTSELQKKMTESKTTPNNAAGLASSMAGYLDINL